MHIMSIIEAQKQKDGNITFQQLESECFHLFLSEFSLWKTTRTLDSKLRFMMTMMHNGFNLWDISL